MLGVKNSKQLEPIPIPEPLQQNRLDQMLAANQNGRQGDKEDVVIPSSIIMGGLGVFIALVCAIIALTIRKRNTRRDLFDSEDLRNNRRDSRVRTY